MPFLEKFDERGMRPSPRLTADALTGIHVANLGLPPSWLPAVQADPKGLLWLTTGEDLWQQALADPDFASEFDRYTRRLARAMQRFLRAIEHLAAEGDTLTLLAVDLLPDEVRFCTGGLARRRRAPRVPALVPALHAYLALRGR